MYKLLKFTKRASQKMRGHEQSISVTYLDQIPHHFNRSRLTLHGGLVLLNGLDMYFSTDKWF